jgi:hypothetical protein
MTTVICLVKAWHSVAAQDDRTYQGIKEMLNLQDQDAGYLDTGTFYVVAD